MERRRKQGWFNLPFSLGCTTQSSVAVATSTHPQNATPTSIQASQLNSSSIVKKANYSIPIAFGLPKANISVRIRSFLDRLRSVTKIFAYRDEGTEEEEEEEEMEIGHPTDVKHLTHIGWDGSTIIPNPDLTSFPTVSLKQFEIAMAVQAQGFSHAKLLVNSSNT